MTMIYTYDGTNSSCNLTTAAVTNSCDIFYYFKQTLKQAGWTVVRSGDGSASPGTSGVNYGSADYITGYATGANGLNNNGAWYVLQQPSAVAGATRQILVQRSASDARSFSVSYSYSAGFSGGSWNARTAPTATDSQVISNCVWTNTILYRYSIAADNAAPHGFYMFAFPVSGGNPICALMMDPLTAADASDADPYIFYSSLNSAAATQTSPLLLVGIGSESAGTGPVAWYKKGVVGSETWVTFPGLSIAIPGQTQFPGSVNSNIYSNKDEVMPIIYARPTALTTQTGYKGVGTLMKWVGPSRNTGDTLTINTSKDYIVVGSVAIPWNGSSPIV